MPTPDDAMVSPVEHESIAGRSTCPPEESRVTPTRALSQTPDFNANSNGDSVIDVPMQLPTPPPQEPSSRAQPPPEPHSKPSSARIEAPARDTPTPMTSTDDGAEEQRISQASPLSATAPPPTSPYASHLSSPFPAHRVCDSDILSRRELC
jgi:hypothetical protein